MIRRLMLRFRTNRSLRAEVNHLDERIGREVISVAFANRFLLTRLIQAEAFIRDQGLGEQYGIGPAGRKAQS